MLRVLAVDDQPGDLAELARLLGRDERVAEVIAAGDAASALRGLGLRGSGEAPVDAVFTDVGAAGLGGEEFVRLLARLPVPPQVVFVTAREDFAVQAFDLEAVDFLLKPVRPDRLAQAVRRVESAVLRAGSGPADELVPVELGGRTRFVARSAVRYAEAQGDYVRLHTAEGGYLVRMSLAALARRWEGAGFVRIHRSTLVSVRHITELRFDGGRVLVRMGAESLPVSRRHSRDVRDLLIRRFRQGERGRPPGETGNGAASAGSVSRGELSRAR